MDWVRALSFSKEVVGLFGLYSRSLLKMLDRGEVRALSFSKECQSMWLYLPVNNNLYLKGVTPERGWGERERN